MKATMVGRERREFTASCWLLAVVLFVGLVPSLWAHGDLHERIVGITAEIAKTPGDATLYVARAELYRLHQEFDLAFADLDKAAELAPDLADTAYIRARVYVDLKCPQAALAAFSRHLAQAPAHVEGWVQRAQLYHALKRDVEAAADYGAAIAKAKDPLPEYYIERARLLNTLADPPAGGEAAVACLDEGIAKLGPIVTLELEAIAYEQAGRKWDGALKRITLLMEQTPRKESWQERKGQVLEQAGRTQEAWTAYRDGLAAIEQLPERTRVLPMTKELKTRLEAGLQRVTSPAPAPTPTPTLAP